MFSDSHTMLYLTATEPAGGGIVLFSMYHSFFSRIFSGDLLLYIPETIPHFAVHVASPIPKDPRVVDR